MKRKKIIIIGAGLTGLSTSFFLNKRDIEAPIFEREKEYGGLCRSIKKDGFTFDFSGHLLHFKNRKIRSLVSGLLANNLARYKRNAKVYAFNKFIPYPFQTNLHSLPTKIAKECLSGLRKVYNDREASFDKVNFFEWINKKFGKGIARHFMIPYNEKFWKTNLKKLTHDWTERFFVMPSARDLIKNSTGQAQQNLGYNAFFWYPKRGGIEELIKAFASQTKDIYLNHEVQEIDLKRKNIKFKNGSTKKFDILISTIPLPELGRIIRGLSRNMLTNFKKLRWVSIYNINLGITERIRPDCHWIYFPQKGISFFRVGFFHNFSNYLAPHGNSSLYAEISYSKTRPIDKKNILLRVIKDLRKVGVVPQYGRICLKAINDIKYGYPIYDRNYSSVRGKIINFLMRNSIISCGRFGGWRYLSMEDAIIEAKKVVSFLSKNS